MVQRYIDEAIVKHYNIFDGPKMAVVNILSLSAGERYIESPLYLQLLAFNSCANHRWVARSINLLLGINKVILIKGYNLNYHMIAI